MAVGLTWPPTQGEGRNAFADKTSIQTARARRGSRPESRVDIMLLGAAPECDPSANTAHRWPQGEGGGCFSAFVGRGVTVLPFPITTGRRRPYAEGRKRVCATAPTSGRRVVIPRTRETLPKFRPQRPHRVGGGLASSPRGGINKSISDAPNRPHQVNLVIHHPQ